MKTTLSKPLIIPLYALCLYAGIAQATFQIRNPKANEWTFWTEFTSVMTFKKLEQYQ